LEKRTLESQFGFRGYPWRVLSANYLSDHTVNINPDVLTKLESYASNSAGEAYSPTEIFGTESLSDPKILAVLLLGGFLVGFGSEYAAGCTSGHAISGLSNLQLSSLVSVIEFFIRGLIMANFIYPSIFLST
jgi:hypothetical protein